MITVSIKGAPQIISNIERIPLVVKKAVRAKLDALGMFIEGYVKRLKLSGQVLNRVSGNLSRSIHWAGFSSGSAEFTRVFSDGSVKYAGIHEYGGQTKPHVITARKAGALAFMGKDGQTIFRRSVNHPGSKMPERSFLRSTLDENATNIENQLRDAVVQSIVMGIKG